jgi:hypothetical protein
MTARIPIVFITVPTIIILLKTVFHLFFFLSGIHEDYHKPGDDVEKIEFDVLTKRTQLAFAIAWEIANRDKSLGFLEAFT